MSRNKVILMGASALVYVSMTGCSSMVASISRESSVTSLNNEITVMRQDVDRGTPNSCYKLVQQYDKLAALKSYSFEARIDYEFIKQACVALLEKKYILREVSIYKEIVASMTSVLRANDYYNNGQGGYHDKNQIIEKPYLPSPDLGIKK